MSKRTPKLSTQILDEAAAWLIDLNEGEPDTVMREDFNAWLRRSPEHVRAFLQMSASWEDFGAWKKAYADSDALILRAKQEVNVFPLELGGGRNTQEVPRREPSPAVSDRSAPSYPRRRLGLFALAASIVLSIGVGVGTWVYAQRHVYTTDVGEQRSITLEDGSLVQLNSQSRLRVSFDLKARTVELLAGQALFKVAKNPALPFVVRSGTTSVRAVGTAFDVYRKRSETVVTVIEGKVAVQPIASSAPEPKEIPDAERSVQDISGRGRSEAPDLNGLPQKPSEVFLVAGQKLKVSPAAPVAIPEPANVAIATAWTEQKLVFQDTPLRDVVEEFNRYNHQKLVIRDPSLYGLLVTGVFPSADPRRMIQFLRVRLPVTIRDSDDQIEIARIPEMSGTANP